MSATPYKPVEIVSDLVQLKQRIRYWRQLIAKGYVGVNIEVLCSPPDFMLPPSKETTLNYSAEARLIVLDRIAEDELKFEALSAEVERRTGITGDALLEGLQ